MCDITVRLVGSDRYSTVVGKPNSWILIAFEFLLHPIRQAVQFCQRFGRQSNASLCGLQTCF